MCVCVCVSEDLFAIWMAFLSRTSTRWERNTRNSIAATNSKSKPCRSDLLSILQQINFIWNNYYDSKSVRAYKILNVARFGRMFLLCFFFFSLPFSSLLSPAYEILHYNAKYKTKLCIPVRQTMPSSSILFYRCYLCRSSCMCVCLVYIFLFGCSLSRFLVLRFKSDENRIHFLCEHVHADRRNGEFSQRNVKLVKNVAKALIWLNTLVYIVLNQATWNGSVRMCWECSDSKWETFGGAFFNQTYLSRWISFPLFSAHENEGNLFNDIIWLCFMLARSRTIWMDSFLQVDGTNPPVLLLAFWQMFIFSSNSKYNQMFWECDRKLTLCKEIEARLISKQWQSRQLAWTNFELWTELKIVKSIDSVAFLDGAIILLPLKPDKLWQLLCFPSFLGYSQTE